MTFIVFAISLALNLLVRYSNQSNNLILQSIVESFLIWWLICYVLSLFGEIKNDN